MGNNIRIKSYFHSPKQVKKKKSVAFVISFETHKFYVETVMISLDIFCKNYKLYLCLLIVPSETT